ncbi:MAG: hypothetical protein Q8J88_18600, partial [Bacteroidales bacterium]|nr:hypothetical protein [Bacteroidales bacterium]
SALISSVAVFKHHPAARRVSFLCGIIILIWIAVQVAIIGYVSWMQPATTIASLIILFLTYLLPRHKAFI